MPAPNEPSYRTLRLRAKLARLAFELRFHNLRLKAGFDPNQPRVPRGNPDGGQWTRIGAAAGADAGSGAGRAAASAAASGTTSEGDAEERVFVDRSGEQTWRTYVERYRPDSSVESRTVLNRDGSRITTEFGFKGTGSTDQRNTVTLADGTRFTFENSGATQRIFDKDGTLISEAVWTPDGPVPQPRVQQVFFDSQQKLAFERLIGAGAVLYSWWMSGGRSPDNTIFAFNANAFQRSDEAGKLALWVGALTEEQVEEACKRFGDTQRITNEVANSLQRSDFSSASAYGTAVHKGVEKEINGPDPKRLGYKDPDFRAELSIKKLEDEIDKAQIVPYGKDKSLRVDVFDRQRRVELVCAYDIKTGVSGLSFARAVDIVTHIFALFPTTQWVYIIEVRPSR
jgi:hypothetical protein